MKMKKLLAAALAATMIFSSMVTSFVASAAQTVGTITAGTVNAVAGETDTVAAGINIAFPDGVVAPHNIVTVSLAGYTLESVTAIDVTYAAGSASGIVDIDTDGSNLAAGKILFEAPVDNKAPTVLGISFTANFVDADAEDTAVGEYDIVVNGDDMTNLNEEAIGIDAVNGKLIVTAPHVCAPAGEPKIENEVAATCYAEGSYDSVVYCSCGEELSRETLPVAKIAHTPAEATVENNVDATCYAEGSYDSVVYCAVEACKAEISRTPVTVDKTEHTPAEAVVENNVDATCYAEGSYDSVVYCAVAECKHEISRTPVTVDKIAHTPAAPVEENRVEAAPGVAGSYDSVVYCSVEACKAEISRTTNEIPALPEEPAGPVVDSNLVVAGASLGFADSSLQVNFRIRKTVIQLYSKVELVIIPQKCDTNTGNLIPERVEIVPTLTAAGNFFTYAYTDIQLYELGLGIDYMLRAYDAEDNLVAVSSDFSVVPADYLKTLYTTSDDLMKTLITDTLVVGAEAVIMFSAGKEDSDLAKATSIIEGFDTSAATQTIGDMNTVDAFNSYDAKYGNKSSDTYYAAKSAGIGKVANLTYRLRDRQALDVDKFEFKVSYNSVKLNGKTEVYSKSFTSADANAKVARGGQFVTFAFDEVGFCDSDKDILVEVYYDGAKVYDMTYSIESYFAANLTHATTGGTITALAKLGISARAVAASKQ